MTAPANTRTVAPPEDTPVDGLADCERRIKRAVQQLRRLATQKVQLELERLMREAMPSIPNDDEEG